MRVGFSHRDRHSRTASRRQEQSALAVQGAPGELAALWQARQDVVDTTLDRWTLMSPRSDVIISASVFGLDSPWRGAAEMVFAPVLADPASVVDLGAPALAGAGRSGDSLRP